MSVSNPSIRPQSGEAYRQFVMRAHGALMRSVPDPDVRNEQVWAAWAQAHGDPLRERAQQLFPAEQYRLVPNVCYFCEHSTTSADGTHVQYSANSMGDLVDEHNDRADTNNYTAITNGHSVKGQGVPDSIQPKVVGYAGPYRLGMIGFSKPKFAVFADEHHQISDIPTIDRKKRRSVELNRFKDGRRSYIDPVALLGAESPRLPLPVAQYQQDGAIVERYEAPSCVSGGNTYIPRADPIKERHSTEAQNVDMNPNTNDQDAMVRNIVQSLMSTPEFQFVQNLMRSGQGGQPAQPQQPQANPMQGNPGAGQPTDGGQGDQDGGDGMGANDMNKQRYSTQNDDQSLVERFSLLNDEHVQLTEKYSQLEAVNQENMQTVGLLKQAVVQLEQRASDADRTMKIKDLYQQYPHFIEVDQEMETCLYSHGSDMNAEAFDRHVVQLETYAKKSSPVTRMLPGGEQGGKQAEGPEQYSADFSQRVVERYTELANEGKVYSYSEIEAMLRKGE